MLLYYLVGGLIAVAIPIAFVMYLAKREVPKGRRR